LARTSAGKDNVVKGMIGNAAKDAGKAGKT
jgi:hypothetical protein